MTVSKKQSKKTSKKQEPPLNCRECDNVECKCGLIMQHLSECVDLTSQIQHSELYNILVTVFTILQNFKTCDPKFLKEIESVCEKVFTELNPVEMNQTIN